MWTKYERTRYSTSHWELAAVGLAAGVFGPRVQGGVLNVLCDNETTVQLLTTYRARESRMLTLLRSVVLLQCRYRFAIAISHLPGVDNQVADSLSRQLQLPTWYAQRSPAAEKVPVLQRDDTRACIVRPHGLSPQPSSRTSPSPGPRRGHSRQRYDFGLSIVSEPVSIPTRTLPMIF